NLSIKVLKNAKGLSVVSEELGKNMASLFPGLSYRLIPNTVNTDIFRYYPSKPSQVTRFIHISVLDENKNRELILEAFARLIPAAFRLDIIGPQKPGLV